MGNQLLQRWKKFPQMLGINRFIINIFPASRSPWRGDSGEVIEVAGAHAWRRNSGSPTHHLVAVTAPYSFPRLGTCAIHSSHSVGSSERHRYRIVAIVKICSHALRLAGPEMGSSPRRHNNPRLIATYPRPSKKLPARTNSKANVETT